MIDPHTNRTPDFCERAPRYAETVCQNTSVLVFNVTPTIDLERLRKGVNYTDDFLRGFSDYTEMDRIIPSAVCIRNKFIY